jgi:hypothetical protein
MSFNHRASGEIGLATVELLAKKGYQHESIEVIN